MIYLNLFILNYIISSCKLPTKFGEFNLDIHKINNLEISVLNKNTLYNYNNYNLNINLNLKEKNIEICKKFNCKECNCKKCNCKECNFTNVRVHDACATSEIFGSLKCDCNEQLEQSMKYIQNNNGIIIYTPNEGRGIGLANKVSAYNIQEKYNLDTFAANLFLDFPEDCRDYSYIKNIINQYKIDKIKLLSNNYIKLNRLKKNNLNIIDTIPINIKSNKFNINYLKAKKKYIIKNDNK